MNDIAVAITILYFFERSIDIKLYTYNDKLLLRKVIKIWSKRMEQTKRKG